MKNNKKTGFALVEIIVASAIIAITMLSLAGVGVLASQAIFDNTDKTRATFLLDESLEVVRMLRDASWTANIAPLSLNTNYFLEFSGGTWKATTTNIFIDDLFERKIRLESVNRDSNDDIASVGTLDSGTKKITVTVSWNTRNATTTHSISTYITDVFSN